MNGRLALMLALGSLLSAQEAVGQSAGVIQERGPATLEIAAPPKDRHIQLSLSDTLAATLSIAGGKSVQVELPSKLTRSSGWEVLHIEAPNIMKDGGGKQTWRMKFVLAPTLTGEQPLQLEPVSFRVDEG